MSHTTTKARWRTEMLSWRKPFERYNKTSITNWCLIRDNSRPIVWLSKLQTANAPSNTKAECNALYDGIKELKWLREVLIEATIPQHVPTPVLKYILGSNSWRENIQGREGAKHIGMLYHLFTHNKESREAEIKDTPSHLYRLDSHTKVLIGEEVCKHWDY